MGESGERNGKEVVEERKKKQKDKINITFAHSAPVERSSCVWANLRHQNVNT